MVMEVKNREIRNIIVPIDNLNEASLVSDMNIFAFHTLKRSNEF